MAVWTDHCHYERNVYFNMSERNVNTYRVSDFCVMTGSSLGDGVRGSLERSCGGGLDSALDRSMTSGRFLSFELRSCVG